MTKYTTEEMTVYLESLKQKIEILSTILEPENTDDEIQNHLDILSQIQEKIQSSSHTTSNE